MADTQVENMYINHSHYEILDPRSSEAISSYNCYLENKLALQRWLNPTSAKMSQNEVSFCKACVVN